MCWYKLVLESCGSVKRRGGASPPVWDTLQCGLAIYLSMYGTATALYLIKRVGYENEWVTTACLEKEIESDGDIYTSANEGRNKEVKGGEWSERNLQFCQNCVGKPFFRAGSRGVKWVSARRWTELCSFGTGRWERNRVCLGNGRRYTGANTVDR